MTVTKGWTAWTHDEDQKFIKIWNRSTSIEQVSKLTGRSLMQCRGRAQFLRSRFGCDLKLFRNPMTRSSDDITALRLLAKKCARVDPDPMSDPGYARLAARQSFLLEFIKVWQIAKSIDEVMRRFKMTRDRAVTLAAYLRWRFSVPLKFMNSKISYDAALLVSTAQTMLRRIAMGDLRGVPTRHTKEIFSGRGRK